MATEDVTGALDDTDEIELTVTGRSSQRQLSRPVWFVHDSHKLCLLPVTGRQSQWFKNIEAQPEVRITIRGRAWEAEARPTTDPDKVQAVAERFRKKYGASDVKRYYSTLDAMVEVPLA